VLISGKGTDASDWMQIVAPGDPALDAPGDDVGAGLAKQVRDDSAVFPSIARFTRVCAYDRPDTRVDGGTTSTSRSQPHPLTADVRDLHAVLRAIGDPPFVLVPHSYAGWIAELYARRFPEAVAGLVMVDAATHQLQSVMSAEQLAAWDATNRATSAQLREGVEVTDAIEAIDAAPPMPLRPSIVLTADKPYRIDLLPPGTDPEAGLTFAAWLAAQDRLAAELNAEHVTKTRSGHHVYLASPAIVTGAVRQVVDAVRAGR
jgi:pimeloyl-ACP methyl ester carboxylesterase